LLYVITIDGPAGAGKSTVARQLAAILSKRLTREFEYVDTGSMYRAAALNAVRNNIDWDNSAQIVSLTKAASIDIQNGKTFLNGEDVTELVRTPEITNKTRFTADNNSVRSILINIQKEIARKLNQNGKGIVTEGRDQGTLVFPNAPCKFFLTATPIERTKRRCGELMSRGIDESAINFDKVLDEINQRDERDKTRDYGALRKADDAIEIITDGLEINSVLEQLAKIATDKFA
jgi:cytidylate kinase